MSRINVTKTFLPPIEEYEAYLKEIWRSDWLTNQGPLLKQFEAEAKAYLGLDDAYFHFVSNGTLALQLAIRALDITEGEIITTPFSYVATTSSILWERCTPVFVDIDPKSLCIDANKIEAVITDKTKAIMPVHVFGTPCDIDALQKLSDAHNIPIIYDAAHGFGAKYDGKSLLDRGDISICSFHSTKPFHTIEGGAIITRDKELSDKIELLKRFGHNGDDHYMLGMNAKASEFQAAMGLANLKYIDEIIEKRGKVSGTYDKVLDSKLVRPISPQGAIKNHAYYPVLFSDESQLLSAVKKLNLHDIYPRRYFYPSLNTLPYLETKPSCPVSEDVASRILCLPLYSDLEIEDVRKICEIIAS